MTVGTHVARQATRRGAQLAVFDDRRALTWSELDEVTNRLAHVLAEVFDVGEGDRVVLFCPNRSEVLEVLAAAHKIGAVYVGLNFRMDTGDLTSALENAGPAVLIAEDTEALSAIAGQMQVPLVGLDDAGAAGYRALLAAASPEPPRQMHKVDHRATACIVYTSGTTGAPKGVVFDHAAMLQHATVACLEYGIGPGSRYLVQIPHNSSVNITIAPAVAAGATIGFADSRSFDPDRFASTIEAHRMTHTFLVPTQLMRLLDRFSSPDPRLSSIDTLGYGSSPISPDRLGELVSVFGPVFIQLYGMAEVASIATLLTKDDHVAALSSEPRLLASCGRRSYALEVRVVDDAGADVAAGDRGEVVFAGPYVMKGYHRDADRTAQVLIDGWMHSGDVAELDDRGYLYIVDRKKHLIIRGGLNVVPTEIENVLYRHPAVLEAAVVGAPDPEWGERVVAEVALRPGVAASEDELLAFVRSSGLASIKLPERLRVVESLPKNAVGKIDKMAVRGGYWQGERRV